MLDSWNQTLDRYSPVPLYHQLRELIMKDIRAGVLKEGNPLPTEMEICETTQLSRPTVRQALNVLTSEGYLIRRKGKGTIVSRPKLEANFIQKLESFHTEMQNQGLVPRTEVMRIGVIPADPVCNTRLSLQPAEKLIVLERLCLANEEPVMYQISYLPAERFIGLLMEDMTTHSLYSTLQARFGVVVMHVHRQIEAVNAGAREADKLGISRGDAICLVQNTAYDQNGSAVEYNMSYYRGDRSKFTMDMYNNTGKPYQQSGGQSA